MGIKLATDANLRFFNCFFFHNAIANKGPKVVIIIVFTKTGESLLGRGNNEEPIIDKTIKAMVNIGKKFTFNFLQLLYRP